MAGLSKIQKATAGAATPQVQAVISLNPDTFQAGGGLITDVDVVFTALQFLMWDYDGKIATPVPALGVTMRLVGEEDDPDPAKDHDQYYSCGDPADWAPNADGSGLVPVGTKTGLTNSTNAGIFMVSLKNAGVPTALFETGTVQSFVGLRAHVQRVPAPERANQQARPDGRKPEICIVTKLLALPGEGQTGPKAVASRPGLSKVSAQVQSQVQARPNGAPVQTVGASMHQVQPTAAQQTQVSSSAGDASLDEILVPIVLEIVSNAGGRIDRKMIGPKVFMAFKEDKTSQGPAMRRATDETFLMGLTEAGFTYDGATLSLG